MRTLLLYTFEVLAIYWLNSKAEANNRVVLLLTRDSSVNLRSVKLLDQPQIRLGKKFCSKVSFKVKSLPVPWGLRVSDSACVYIHQYLSLGYCTCCIIVNNPYQK